MALFDSVANAPGLEGTAIPAKRQWLRSAGVLALVVVFDGMAAAIVDVEANNLPSSVGQFPRVLMRHVVAAVLGMWILHRARSWPSVKHLPKRLRYIAVLPAVVAVVMLLADDKAGVYLAPGAFAPLMLLKWRQLAHHKSGHLVGYFTYVLVWLELMAVFVGIGMAPNLSSRIPRLIAGGVAILCLYAYTHLLVQVLVDPLRLRIAFLGYKADDVDRLANQRVVRADGEVKRKRPPLPAFLSFIAFGTLLCAAAIVLFSALAMATNPQGLSPPLGPRSGQRLRNQFVWELLNNVPLLRWEDSFESPFVVPKGGGMASLVVLFRVFVLAPAVVEVGVILRWLRDPPDPSKREPLPGWFRKALDWLAFEDVPVNQVNASAVVADAVPS